MNANNPLGEVTSPTGTVGTVSPPPPQLQIREPKEFEGEGFRLTVNGQEKILTVDQIIREAQKNLAGEDKLKAAHLRTTELDERETLFQREIETNKAIRDGFANSDVTRLRQGLKGLNPPLPDQYIDELLFGKHGEPEPPDTEPDNPTSAGSPTDSLTPEAIQKAVAGALAPLQRDIERLQQESEERQATQKTNEYRQQVENALVGDIELGKLWEQANPEAKSTLQDMVFQSVAAQHATGNYPEWGPRLLEAGLNTAKGKLRTLGSLVSDNSPNQPAPVGPSDTPAYPSGGAYLANIAGNNKQNSQEAFETRITRALQEKMR